MCHAAIYNLIILIIVVLFLLVGNLSPFFQRGEALIWNTMLHILARSFLQLFRPLEQVELVLIANARRLPVDLRRVAVSDIRVVRSNLVLFRCRSRRRGLQQYGLHRWRNRRVFNRHCLCRRLLLLPALVRGNWLYKLHLAWQLQRLLSSGARCRHGRYQRARQVITCRSRTLCGPSCRYDKFGRGSPGRAPLRTLDQIDFESRH